MKEHTDSECTVLQRAHWLGEGLRAALLLHRELCVEGISDLPDKEASRAYVS